jgi:hypothetical protein
LGIYYTDIPDSDSNGCNFLVRRNRPCVLRDSVQEAENNADIDERDDTDSDGNCYDKVSSP